MSKCAQQLYLETHFSFQPLCASCDTARVRYIPKPHFATYINFSPFCLSHMNCCIVIFEISVDCVIDVKNQSKSSATYAVNTDLNPGWGSFAPCHALSLSCDFLSLYSKTRLSMHEKRKKTIKQHLCCLASQVNNNFQEQVLQISWETLDFSFYNDSTFCSLL